MLLDKCRNEDGTYDGIKLLSLLSGVSEAEVAWSAERIRELLRAGTPGREAARIAMEEAKGQPWLKS